MSTYYIPTYLQVHWLLVHMQVPICRYHNIVTLKYVVYPIRTYVFCGISIFSMSVTICRYMFKCRYIYIVSLKLPSPHHSVYTYCFYKSLQEGRYLPHLLTMYRIFPTGVFGASYNSLIISDHRFSDLWSGDGVCIQIHPFSNATIKLMFEEKQQLDAT